MKLNFVRTLWFLPVLLVNCAAATDLPADPLDSVMWAQMHRDMLDSGPVVFDERVRVTSPAEAEDSMNVPVFVDASALPHVKRMVVFAELNPIPKILEMEPLKAAARVGFRLKVQQATPVRAAALTEDGVWHLGGVLVDAAGGGCTAPSVGSGNADWSSRLGEVSARLWVGEGVTRLRARVMHPMDTGLVAGIPAFYIETLDVLGPDEEVLTRLSLYEPVSENPLLTLDLPPVKELQLRARDNNGNPVLAQVSSAVETQQ